MADYIPAGNVEFEVWLNNFAAKIQVYGPAVGATPAEILEIMSAYSRFHPENLFVQVNHNAYRAAVATRDDDRHETIEPRLREFVQRIQNAPGMTDPIRLSLGITVRDETPTMQGAKYIEGMLPPLLVVDIGQAKRAALYFGPNPLNARLNGLPEGVRGVRLWYVLGSAPPAEEKAWVFLDEDNRSPYMHVTMNAEPLTITYRASYVDRHNRISAPCAPVTVTINP